MPQPILQDTPNTRRQHANAPHPILVPPRRRRRHGRCGVSRDQRLLLQRPGEQPAPSASPTAAASGRHMSAPDFSNAVDKPSTIVLDVRTPAEYATGHLSGAENIDLQGADFATRIATLDKKATYAVYCHSGRRSGDALEQMAADGFTQVFDLAGGITAWQANGGTLEMPSSTDTQGSGSPVSG